MLIEVSIPNYYNVIKHFLSLERTLYSSERRTQGKSPPIDAVKCKQKIFFKCIGRSHRNRLLFRQLKLSTPLSCIIRMINEGRNGSKKGVARSLGGQHPLDTRALSWQGKQIPLFGTHFLGIFFVFHAICWWCSLWWLNGVHKKRIWCIFELNLASPLQLIPFFLAPFPSFALAVCFSVC